ncbi:ABC transporter ATP-binding protein [Enterovirga sp. CN4-39]|uniref:ABC transporter ATP-binding protein n=1 Tax=Enterovirga sp. CN4-39 TaxID=3400910 RepID=UPI003C090FF4
MSILVPEPLLQVRDLRAGYGNVAVLHDVSVEVRAGELLALLGPNGAGKSTLLRVISNLLPTASGSVRFDGRDLRGRSPRDVVRNGLVHVLEGHRVFSGLSVRHNLLLAGYDVPRSERAQRVEEAFAYFPELAAKRDDLGSLLSGGQQQMLAVAQGIVRRPKLLMLDEPSAGLSPVLVDRVLAVATRLKETGTAILLVEQLVEKSIRCADRVCALAQGRIVLRADAQDADLVERIQDAYFGGSLERSH